MTGYKTWAAGEILTASDLNGYLRDQSIPIFASTATRDAAITAPTEGQFCYVTADDTTYIYVTSWVAYDQVWKSWTPTWSGVTKGSGPTETYAYIRIGKFVIAHGSLTLGTSGSLAGPVTVTMPVASATTAISTTAGAAFISDASPAATYQGTVDIATNSTTATIRASNSSTTYLTRTDLSASVPLGAAFAVGDKIGFNVMYQVA